MGDGATEWPARLRDALHFWQVFIAGKSCHDGPIDREGHGSHRLAER
jgi:hypothetical protein